MTGRPDLSARNGAMVAEGYDDPEGDLLTRIRALVGPKIPVICTLDPHSHLTAKGRPPPMR